MKMPKLWLRVKKQGKWYKKPFAKSDKSFIKTRRKKMRQSRSPRGRSNSRRFNSRSSSRFSRNSSGRRFSRGRHRGNRNSSRFRRFGKGKRGYGSRRSWLSSSRSSSRRSRFSVDSRASTPWARRRSKSRGPSQKPNPKKKVCNKCGKSGHKQKNCPGN